MKDWASLYLHTFLKIMYEDEEEAQENIDRLQKICGENLRKLEKSLNVTLKGNVSFMKIGDFPKNINWINSLKKTLGKNQLGRDGIYFLEQVLEYWETRNNNILLMLSEGENTLINSLNES